ncbi:SAV_915 family protein [Streptomyces sp. NPDC059153]|uniref:SAV_915 family protein n=1 Tax=Streptomyces sp. NPDC059153 TaxID=3346743 RepID=UPI00368DABD2
MNDNQRAEDPDPLQPNRTGALFVPVRPGPVGYCARLFRTPLGVRTAVAFTNERRLTLTLGQRQTWIRLSEPAVRALVAPLGVLGLVVDPLLAAPGPSASPAVKFTHRTAPAPQRELRPDWDLRAVDVVRATGTQSLSPASTS